MAVSTILEVDKLGFSAGECFLNPIVRLAGVINSSFSSRQRRLRPRSGTSRLGTGSLPLVSTPFSCLVLTGHEFLCRYSGLRGQKQSQNCAYSQTDQEKRHRSVDVVLASHKQAFCLWITQSWYGCGSWVVHPEHPVDCKNDPGTRMNKQLRQLYPRCPSKSSHPENIFRDFGGAFRRLL